MLSPDIKVASSKEVNEKELPSSIKNNNNPFKRVSRVKSTSTETRKVKNFSVVAKKNYTNNTRIVKNQNIGISKKRKTNISTETGKKDQKPTKITADSSQVGEQSKTAKDTNRNYQKILETSKVMTQSPSTTKSVTASTAVSQASYSLDFLHSVGVHMTAGSNRTFNPIPSPSPLYANTNRTKCSFSRNTPAFLSEQQCNNNYTKLIYKDHINSTAGLISNRNITPLHCCGVLYQAPYCFPESNYLNHSHNQQCIQNSMGAECQQFPNNRNIHLKKGWNWNNAFKRCSTYVNKFGSTSNNELSSSDAIPRARPHQHFRNLRYVLTDNNRYNSNSKSPTPSPKSESSFLSKSHINQKSVLHLNIEQNLMDTSAMANPISNGYESDSSHSSCRQSEYECCVKNDFEPSSHEIGEAMSLLNFPAYSEEDIRNSQPHCYGSYQNLAYLGTTLNSNYNSPTVYNTVSHETNNHYFADGPMKRSQCHNKSYRGRRQSYINCRSQHFYENLYTPPDKFLAKAHLVQVKGTPETLLNGSKWDQLSQDIWNNFLLAQQTEETFKKKMYLWRYLYVTIKKAYPRFGLYMVGSTISGFGADTSDTDMCLVCRTSSNIDPRMEALLNLTQIKEYLSQSGVFEQFNLIEAKVPILRFKDSMHLLEVDLNFNNSVGIRNTHLLYCYSQYWRLRPLVLITKLWAQYHNINNAKNMTISSYSLSLMVIHFLQCGIHPPVLPCLHNLHPDKFQIILQSNDFGFVDMTEDIGPYRSENTQTIGELFLKFLEYFSNFDYAEKAISVRTGTVLPIEECRQAKSIKNDVHQWKELCIEEPFDLTNTARSVYDCDIFGRIRSIFISSFKHLQESLNINSIFTPVDGVVDPEVVQKTVAAP